MIDREKVIAGLKECLELLNCVGTQEECKQYVADAIELLEDEQEIAQNSDGKCLNLKACYNCGHSFETTDMFGYEIMVCNKDKERQRHVPGIAFCEEWRRRK